MARDYGAVCHQFWTGKTGRELQAAGSEAVIVALYLVTNRHANAIGLYYLPVQYIAHETGLPFEGALKGLRSCSEGSFCAYDEASETVWVYEMARIQIGERLSPKDNRVKNINKWYSQTDNSPFLGKFYDRYKDDFHLEKRRGSKGAPKTLRSQDKTRQEQDKNKTTLMCSSKPLSSDIERVWKSYERHHPKAQLSKDRKALIARRLKDHTADQLIAAIDGNHRDPWCCGENDSGKKHHDLSLILRNADKIEKYAAVPEHPAPGGNGTHLPDRDMATYRAFQQAAAELEEEMQ